MNQFARFPIMKLMFVLVCLVLTMGCVKVGGKYRCLNRRTISELQCHETNDKEQLDIVVLDYRSSPLPGSRVSLKSEHGELLTATIDYKSEISFPVQPATWSLSIELEGFNSHNQIIKVESHQSCKIHIYLGDEPVEQFQ